MDTHIIDKSMGKVCIINQPAGLGDIIFCQKIGYEYMNHGYQIKWAIDDAYLDDVKKYISSPFEFTERRQYGIHMDMIPPPIYLNLDGCERLIGKRIMESKYIHSGIHDYSDWKSYFHINRDTRKENVLFDYLGLKEDDAYSLVNYNYGSPPHTARMHVDTTNNLKKVQVEFIQGFSIFDWCKVIEHATEICITDSAMALIVEKLKPTKCQHYTIILRMPTSVQVDLMYELDWSYKVGRKR